VDVRDRWSSSGWLVAASYLAGAVPWSQIVARRRGVDLRAVDNGTVSGTGLYQVAGFVPLAVAGSLDVAKGALGPAVAGPGRAGLAATSAAAAVAGHNWSIFLRGAGGRGISPALGALTAGAPAGAGVLLGGLVAGRLSRQTGLGCFVAYLAVVPVTRRCHGWRGALLATGVLVPLLAKRVAGNRPPRTWDARTVIHRVLLDCDPSEPRRRAGVRRLAA
jgi:acyl phosphate:glycerol-3-phosphate acyltransferase